MVVVVVVVVVFHKQIEVQLLCYKYDVFFLYMSLFIFGYLFKYDGAERVL